ncbi:MAG: thiazole biosynthesis adenylyltransferase ThiF, partial [Acidobacteriota bacterium]|nr:thiazole biosynthesis adenylyltransferase ThiF [Acidobacteriota bacterium]
AVQITPAAAHQIDLADLAGQLRDVGEVSYNCYLLKLKTIEHEITVFTDARCVIQGTDDPNVARSLYARYIGA